MKNAKRILAIVGLVIIIGWIVATVVMAITNFPNKETIFPVFIAGCVVFPIFLWIIIWMFGVLTNQKTIASFRSEEMEKTMDEAERIKDKLAQSGNLKNINDDKSEE